MAGVFPDLRDAAAGNAKNPDVIAIKLDTLDDTAGFKRQWVSFAPPWHLVAPGVPTSPENTNRF